MNFQALKDGEQVTYTPGSLTSLPGNPRIHALSVHTLTLHVLFRPFLQTFLRDLHTSHRFRPSPKAPEIQLGSAWSVKAASRS